MADLVTEVRQLRKADIYEKWKFWKRTGTICILVSLALFFVIVVRGFDTLGFYPDGSGGISSDSAVLLFIFSFLAAMEYTEYTWKPEIRRLYPKVTRRTYIWASILMLVASASWICANTDSFIVYPVIRAAIIEWCASFVLFCIGYCYKKLHG